MDIPTSQLASTILDCAPDSSEQHISFQSEAHALQGVDDSDGEIADSSLLADDIVHNATPLQTALRPSIALKTKGGNIATAADSLVHEITAERGVFKNSVLCEVDAIVMLAGLVTISPTKTSSSRSSRPGAIYEFRAAEFRAAKVCRI